MARDLDIGYIQQEIIDFLDTNRPHVKHIVDGLVDGEAPETTPSGAIKPFVVVWFRSLRRSGARRGTRAVSGARMDAYTLGFDLVCVASDGTSARAMVNDYNDILIGRKFQHTGQLVTDAALCAERVAAVSLRVGEAHSGGLFIQSTGDVERQRAVQLGSGGVGPVRECLGKDGPPGNTGAPEL